MAKEKRSESERRPKGPKGPKKPKKELVPPTSATGDPLNGSLGGKVAQESSLAREARKEAENARQARMRLKAQGNEKLSRVKGPTKNFEVNGDEIRFQAMDDSYTLDHDEVIDLAGLDPMGAYWVTYEYTDEQPDDGEWSNGELPDNGTEIEILEGLQITIKEMITM